jgi:integrase
VCEMGRPRKDASQGLPKRVYLKSGAFYYVHAEEKPRWENLGPDLAVARSIANAYNSGASVRGTMGWWLDEWIKHVEQQVAKGLNKPRTLKDYKKALPYLNPFFGSMRPLAIEAPHVAEYLSIGASEERPVQANRDKAALSSCMSWMILQKASGLKGNICLQVPRNPETPRDRYITDDEYNAVYDVASVPVRAWMELMYRTLQRPSDILSWTKSNIVEEGGRRMLSFRQSKTGARLKIFLTPQLEKCFDDMAAMRAAQKRKISSLYLICTREGTPYTQMGLSSMARRHITDCNIKDFAPYDCKSKGATDMYTSGTPIEQISALCGHDSITTTEIYIKRHLVAPIVPNCRETERPSKAA